MFIFLNPTIANYAVLFRNLFLPFDNVVINEGGYHGDCHCSSCGIYYLSYLLVLNKKKKKKKKKI